MKKIRKFCEKNYIYIVFLISFSAVIGSLYYSNIQDLNPCVLCWYQRILIYPLLFLSSVSIIFSEKLKKRFIACLTIPGMFVALYHYLLQKFNFGAEFVTCAVGTPCTKIDVQYLGFITIPLMSFFAFLTINIVLLLATKVKKESEAETEKLGE